MIKLARNYRIIFKMENSPVGVGWVESGLKSGYGELDFIFVCEDKTVEAFLPEKELKRAAIIGYEIARDSKKMREIFSKIKKILLQVRKVFKKYDYLNLEKLDETAFKKALVEYFSAVDRLYKYFSYTEFYYFTKIEDEIRKFIDLRVKDKAYVNTLLNDLLTSQKTANILTKEELDRLDLRLADKAILDHLKKYDFIPYAFGQPSWSIDSFKKILNKISKKPRKLLIRKRNKILEEDRLVLEKQKAAEKYLNLSDEIKNLIRAVRDWQEIKWQMRIYLNRTFASRDALDFNFLKNMAKRTNYPVEYIGNMFYQETRDILNGKRVDTEEIKKRIGMFAGFVQNKRLVFLFGKEAKQFAQEVRQRTVGYYQKQVAFKGRIASPGKVSGKARVFTGIGAKDFKAQVAKMRKGEIIVAESTGPEYMPAILKAKAIVADEGGITSHAAIISRELKIPCVVGTHFAIRNIKTGDLIEVDANEGTVKVLNKNI